MAIDRKPEHELAASAPAKLNLYLHVLGRRDDGYHRLDSLIAFAGIGDRIVVLRAGRLVLTVEGPFAAEVPSGDDNLVLKAARALAEAASVPPHAAIHLVKNLPVAAGIGGGSADAAAALKALATLWRIPDKDALLPRLAPALGADVPVCLYGRPAFIGGIGEEITPAPPLPPAWLVLANPGVWLSTAEVFAHRRGPYSAPGRFEAAPPTVASLAATLGARRNDLAPAAVELAPAIAEVLAALTALPGAHLARMSGSGASCFALFGEERAARDAAANLAAAFPEWWIAAAPLLAD